MDDYGAKASLPGFDVSSVIDYLQLFNSSWPLLKIETSGQFSGSVSHGLGYPPFHIVANATGGVDQFADNYGVNASDLARTSGAGSPRYYICRLDLSTNYTAPIIPGGTAPSTENDEYGIKVALPGKDTSSTDMRDFSIHSGARSPMVHKVSNQNMGIGGSGWELVIPHGLSYIPRVFVFFKPNAAYVGPNYDSDRYVVVPPPVGVGGFYYQVDSANVSIFADGFFFTLAIPTVSVVVLKDPLAKEVINVSFP